MGMDHPPWDCGNYTGRRPVESENSPGVMPTTKGEMMGMENSLGLAFWFQNLIFMTIDSFQGDSSHQENQ